MIVSMTRTINLDRSKNKTSQIVGTSFAPKQKNKMIFFDVIATKSAYFLFEKKIDNAK